MMCEHTSSAALSGYADACLPEPELRWWTEHVAGCVECREELARIGSLRGLLRENLTQAVPPREFVDALRQRLRDEDAPRAARTNGVTPIHAGRPRNLEKKPVFLRWQAGIAATLLFAAGFALGHFPGRPAGDSVVAEIVSGHLRSLEVDHLVDVASSEHHVVRPWFTGKLDFSPPVPDLAADSFPLLGARVDYLEGRPVAALVYARGPHRINLFVRPDPPVGGCTRDAPIVRRGFNLMHGRVVGMEFWAVSDLNRQELTEFASRWQQRSAPGDPTCRATAVGG